MTPSSGSPSKRLGLVLDSIVPADVSQFLILRIPPFPGSIPYEVGRFRIGRLDRNKLLYGAQRTKCDFFKRYKDAFENRDAVEGSFIKTRVVDWWALQQSHIRSWGQVVPAWVDSYYDLLTYWLHGAFLTELWNTQLPYVAAGAPIARFDRTNTVLMEAFVCIHQHIGADDTGYFCPFHLGYAIDHSQADVRVPATRKTVEELYGFHGWEQTKLHDRIRLFCHSLVRAKIFESDEDPELAFLHYVMALDRLLGVRDQVIQAVSRRAAVLLSRGDPSAFREVKAEIEDIYERRSRFVHVGEARNLEDLAEVAKKTTSVFEALMRLQSREESRSDDFPDQWLKNLDFVASGFAAGHTLDSELLVSVGVLVPEGVGSGAADV
jgi:hypothetical protein